MRASSLLLAACALLVAYGSLFPFDFEAPPSLPDALRAFATTFRWWTFGADVVANVALFAPLGALGALRFAASPRRTLGEFVLAGVGFALLLQLAQIWLPARTAELSDVLWNFVGLLAGIALVEHGWRQREPPLDDWFGAALLGAWAVAQVAPFAAVHGRRWLGAALVAVWTQPRVDALAALVAAAQVLALGCIAASFAPRWRALRLAALLAALLAVSLAVRFGIGGRVATPADLLGAVLGVGAWCWLRVRHSQQLHRGALAVLFVATTIAWLAPFTLRAEPTRFQWLPFAALLRSAVELSLWLFAEAVFLFGALLWLARQCGHAPARSAAWLAGWVLMLEFAQRWIVGRSGDVTMPLLVLGLGALLHAGARDPPRPISDQPAPPYHRPP